LIGHGSFSSFYHSFSISHVIRLENWNSAAASSFTGAKGNLHEPPFDQEVAMLTLHLLQSALVFINTLMIQDILSGPA